MSSLIEAFKRGARLLTLDGDAADEIARDDKAILPAVLIVAIGGLVVSLSFAIDIYEYKGYFSEEDKSWLYQLWMLPLIAVVVSFIYAGLIFLISKLIEGKGDFRSYYAAIGTGSITLWGLPIPWIGGLLAFWILPITFTITRRTLGLTKLQSQILVLAIALPLYVLCFYFYLLEGMTITGSPL